MHSLIPFSLPKIPKAFIMYMWVCSRLRSIHVFVRLSFFIVVLVIRFVLFFLLLVSFLFRRYFSVYFIRFVSLFSSNLFEQNKPLQCSGSYVNRTTLLCCTARMASKIQRNQCQYVKSRQTCRFHTHFALCFFRCRLLQLKWQTVEFIESSCCNIHFFSSIGGVPFVLYSVIIPKMDSLKRIDRKNFVQVASSRERAIWAHFWICARRTVLFSLCSRF